MRLVVLGRQGAGKGTQCARLADRLGVVHVATGDLFRVAMAEDSELGRRVATFVGSGELVPDDLAVAVVSETVTSADVADKGFVLDGFPRTVRQAEQLDAVLAPGTIDVAIDLTVGMDVVLGRLLNRRVCVRCGHVTAAAPNTHCPPSCARCGGAFTRRADDTEPLIRRRLAIYEEQARPVLRWYAAQGALRTVDGHGPEAVVANRVDAAIKVGRAEDEARIALERLSSELRTPTIVLDDEQQVDAGRGKAIP